MVNQKKLENTICGFLIVYWEPSRMWTVQLNISLIITAETTMRSVDYFWQ